MIIIDGNKRKKNAVSLKVITHEVRDAINKGAIPTQFVEAVIKGKHRTATWIEWYPLAEFRKNNPGVRI
ncbi:hypothetical protein GW915_12100 [bacterium]|nr:hypothetical protein [bacterium]